MADLQNIIYEPTLPDNRDEFTTEFLIWLDREHNTIAQAIAGNREGYEVSTSPPDKLRVGMVRYADGTAWNPGSGEGLYVYKSGGWTLIA